MICKICGGDEWKVLGMQEAPGGKPLHLVNCAGCGDTRCCQEKVYEALERLEQIKEKRGGVRH